MGIRLNKVLTELNLGLQTAINYLKENKIGEIKADATVNTKISDEQYEALTKEFKDDKEIISKARKIFLKKDNNSHKVFLEESPQQYTPLGKIDLANYGIKDTDNYVDKIDYEKALAEINQDEKETSYTSHCDSKTMGNAQTGSRVTADNLNETKASSNGFDCVYRDKFLSCYKDSSAAYKKENWSEWFTKGRSSIEFFCKYYICWLCGEDTIKANKILKGYCDFENVFPKNKRTEPQGRRLITLIFQENGDKLKEFVTDGKLNSTYEQLSEFVHIKTTPNNDNVVPIQRVLDRLYSIFYWTQNRNYSDIRLTGDNTHYYIEVKGRKSFKFKINDAIVKKSKEGDYVILIKNKGKLLLYREYTHRFDTETIYKLLKNDWIFLKQELNYFKFELDFNKISQELRVGLSIIKDKNNENIINADYIFNYIQDLKELGFIIPNSDEFVLIYQLVKKLVSTSRIVILKEKYVSDDSMNFIWIDSPQGTLDPIKIDYSIEYEYYVVKDEIRAEDDNLFWGKDARMYMKGIDHNRDIVDKWIKIKIPKSKSETIKKINSHDYLGFTLVSLADGFYFLHFLDVTDI